MDPSDHSHLPRLDDSAYEGLANVHWSFTMKDRKTGWMNPNFHHYLREILIHGLARYGALCPAYCLMPDHAHFLIVGWDEYCKQKLLVRFLRKHSNSHLKTFGFKWQKQPYDRVLRENDKQRDPFQSLIGYIIENPVRAGLIERWEDWQFTDSMIPGYPEVRIRDVDFWDRYWKLYYANIS